MFIPIIDPKVTEPLKLPGEVVLLGRDSHPNQADTNFAGAWLANRHHNGDSILYLGGVEGGAGAQYEIKIGYRRTDGSWRDLVQLHQDLYSGNHTVYWGAVKADGTTKRWMIGYDHTPEAIFLGDTAIGLRLRGSDMTFTAGTPTTNGHITVNINGTVRKLMTTA
jgi:hypothetical protein